MPVECLLIVRALIAEERAEVREERPVSDELVPEVMADFVAEMPQKRAIGLLLQGTLPLAMHIVGFRDVNGDEAVIVTGEHPLGIAVRRVLEELEGQAAVVAVLRLDRKIQAHERIEQAALRDLEPEPGDLVSFRGQIGNDAIQAARAAEVVRFVHRHDPVAHTHLIVICAQTIGTRVARWNFRLPHAILTGHERGHEAPIGQKGERVPAVQAADILEEHQILAVAAVKSLHR